MIDGAVRLGGWFPSEMRPAATTNRKESAVSPQPARPEPHINLNIKSTSGNLSDVRFNAQNRAQLVLDRATKDIPLDPKPARPYKLVLERDGRSLDLGEKLAELDVRGGDTVIVQAGQPVEG